MTTTLSPNAQAILLLTAPLIAGHRTAAAETLTAGEYKRLARHLRGVQREPADLLSADAADLRRSCAQVVRESRLNELLGRGVLLSQAVERWHARAIWVVSRADAEYPRHLKARLREDAPAVLYGCGAVRALDAGGLAIVGSRDADEASLLIAADAGRLAARAGRNVVSGGARGIDQAAMRGALDAGGTAIGILADSLEKAALTRENRSWLIDGRLVLLSPHDPAVGFSVGNAMQRNKFIYALADAALVVCSAVNKGGTWAGATEQLDRLRLVPVYVPSTATPSAGLSALLHKGALRWPNPQDVEAFDAVLHEAPTAAPAGTDIALTLFPDGGSDAWGTRAPTSFGGETAVVLESAQPRPEAAVGASAADRAAHPEDAPRTVTYESRDDIGVEATTTNVDRGPAEALLDAVSRLIQRLLAVPMNESEIAAALQVSTPQAKAWLERLVEDGVVERLGKPGRYAVRLQGSLLGTAVHDAPVRRGPPRT